MDSANLIRMVARSFYETRHILIIDSLFIHSVLNADDLALLLNMQKKDLRKLCVKLRDDRMLAVHTRSEIRDGQTRPVNHEYYFIPLHPVIDAIKYRVSKLTSEVKAQFTPQVEKKEYICRRCRAEYTQLEVLGKVGPEGFVCDRCGHPLDRTDEVEGALVDRTGHEKNSKLMSQLDGILKLLKRIDSVPIPANDFDFAWEHRVDVARPGPAGGKDAVKLRAPIIVMKKGQAGVRGTSTTDASSVEVNLFSNAEKGAAELAESERRKAELEKQNALPSWITTSAVAPEIMSASASASVSSSAAASPSTLATTPIATATAVASPAPPPAASATAVAGADLGTTASDIIKTEPGANPAPSTADIKQEPTPQDEADANLNDKVAAYYAAMAAEEEAQRARGAANDAFSSDVDGDGDEDEEDEEDEFEDIVISGATTPAAVDSSASVAPSETTSLKRAFEDDGSATPLGAAVTAAPSPSAVPSPAAKRPKVVDASAAATNTPTSAPKPAPTAAPEDEDDEEDDFEDV
ncbi:General transcription factor IIE subunit 1 [Ascosphaera acerosa]|nr:General transcription factor IIE subunit 1 [Ascosphaera acerosa]